MKMHAPQSDLYGILAEFTDPHMLVHAAEHVRRAGYQRFDAYTPMPIEGLADAIGFRRTAMPYVVLIGAILGGLGGFLLQYWVAVIAYPLNVGGRPLNSWPAFIPITFETTVLAGALSGVLGMLALNGLPRPHHPLFAAPQFMHATTDRFFLCIESRDPKFNVDEVHRLFEELDAVEVIDVPS